MFEQEYYTDCPNTEKKPKVDPEDPTEWVCNWHGTPFMSYERPSILCICPNCGYMWSISYSERNYGGGYVKGSPSDDDT